jgi:hypothetical protein
MKDYLKLIVEAHKKAVNMVSEQIQEDLISFLDDDNGFSGYDRDFVCQIVVNNMAKLTND